MSKDNTYSSADEIKSDLLLVLNRYTKEALTSKTHDIINEARIACRSIEDDTALMALGQKVIDLQANLNDVKGPFKAYKMQKAIDEFEGRDSGFLSTLNRSIKNRVFGSLKDGFNVRDSDTPEAKAFTKLQKIHIISYIQELPSKPLEKTYNKEAQELASGVKHEMKYVSNVTKASSASTIMNPSVKESSSITK